MFRLLLAVCPEEDQLFIPGLREALPHLSPPQWLGLHISGTHLPVPAPPGGTLLRFAPRLVSCLKNTRDSSQRSDIKMSPPFSESADGLCCRLTGPIFIRGFDHARDARPIPTTTRRPTINWKDISRCGRLSLHPCFF